MAVHQIGHAVIAEPRQFDHGLRLAHSLQRRHAERDCLRVVVMGELIHYLQPHIQIPHAWHRLHARADRRCRPVKRQDFLP